MYAADTITAIATPPGAGGIGIVRVSGPLATVIAGSIFARDAGAGTAWESHVLYHGRALDRAGRPLDEALAVVMRGPHSYTGEDVIELHCHGSPVALQGVLQAALARGARLAEPGEFTRRAFLNGRLDLTQAEAVIDLIRARTELGAATAAQQLFGQLSQTLEPVRQMLIDVRARLEVQIDFSEEDVRVDQGQLVGDIESARERVVTLLDSYRRGKLARDGLRVTITGKPNVGKSSLLNALLREERAIVTAVPGTTRDVVEETADFGGVPVVLRDTAGLRDAADPVEEIGVRRARATIADADVVIALFDTSQPWEAEDDLVLQAVAARPVVIAFNKSDLTGLFGPEVLPPEIGGAPVLRLSARTGHGLDDLRAAVVGNDADIGDVVRDRPTVTLARHRDALAKVAGSLALALDGLRAGTAPDLVAVDLQNATDHIAEISGAITNEDVLDRIFSEFCIGK